MNYEYYYNNVPGHGLCRNNLIYTSLISQDKKTFVQWYHNDTDYHKGQNQVVDPSKMEEKWNREIKFLQLMRGAFPNLVPTVLDIDYKNRKIYLEIDGVDLWERAGCTGTDYSTVLPDWREQMLEIIQAHSTMGFYKYSMHPSSYFIVNNKLKSINYFFCYFKNEPSLLISDVMSHISENRQLDLFPKMSNMGIDPSKPISHFDFQKVAFESFKTNFDENTMESAKKIYAQSS
jgi:hypothetical protein